MSNAFKQFWLFFTTLFSAGTKAAQTVENLATVSEEMSGAYLDDTRAQRQLALLENKERLKTITTGAKQANK